MNSTDAVLRQNLWNHIVDLRLNCIETHLFGLMRIPPYQFDTQTHEIKALEEQLKEMNLRSKTEAPLVETQRDLPLAKAGLDLLETRTAELARANTELARIRAVVPASLLAEVDLVEAITSIFDQYVKVAAEATALRKQLADLVPSDPATVHRQLGEIGASMGLASGCCSAVKPCSHQRHDPNGLCEGCRGLARFK